MRRTLHSPDIAVPPVPALTSGLVEGDLGYVTGQLAFNASTGGVPAGLDAAEQAEIVMQRIASLLRSEGLTTADLVRVTIFLANLADLFPVNGVYTRWVSEPYPARSTVGVAFLALPEAKIEIEGVARRRS